MIDINRISGLDRIWEEGEYVHIGPLVTHNHALVSKTLIKYAMPLVKAAQSIGAAQIRNVGTIFGNVITGSPANDTISPLVALNAELLIQSKSEKKWVSITDFYQGVRKTILSPTQMVTDLRFKKLTPDHKGSFIKYLLRNIHGISVANVTVILGFDGELVNDARISLGAVSPTIFRVDKAEKYLLGKKINSKTISITGKLCFEAASPISDIRASEEYRDHILPVLIEKAMIEIQTGTWKDFPEAPVLLWGKNREPPKPIGESFFHNSEYAYQYCYQSKAKTIFNWSKQNPCRSGPRRRGIDRNKNWLRRGRMWCMHIILQWSVCAQLPYSSTKSTRRANNDN